MVTDGKTYYDAWTARGYRKQKPGSYSCEGNQLRIDIPGEAPSLLTLTWIDADHFSTVVNNLKITYERRR